MIVISIDNIENFILFLDRRVMNEIFYEFKELKDDKDLTSGKKVEIILHFLAKVEDYLVLYGTQVTMIKPSNLNIDEEVINELKRIFNQVDPNLLLIKGKIKEIFLSYSS